MPTQIVAPAEPGLGPWAERQFADLVKALDGTSLTPRRLGEVLCEVNQRDGLERMTFLNSVAQQQSGRLRTT